MDEDGRSSRNRSRSAARKGKGRAQDVKEKGKLTPWQMLALTVSMGGSQIAWTV